VKRVSPSMAVALLALFVALGGTGYAAATINGRDIKNRSIAGTKLRRNTLSGAQIRESGLSKVPAASDADFLGGRPPGAYVLASTGIAGNSLRLGGQPASAFLPAGGTAANSALLGGQPASAFLPAGATAANADKLDGKDATDFVPAVRAQAPVLVSVSMPQTIGAVAQTTLATAGPLRLVADCKNVGGEPDAQVGVINTDDFFLVFGETAATARDDTAPQTVRGEHALAHVAPSGNTDWTYARRSFSAFAPAETVTVQGTATAMTQSGASPKGCFLTAWFFVS
jgi:hypothetical protein